MNSKSYNPNRDKTFPETESEDEYESEEEVVLDKLGNHVEPKKDIEEIEKKLKNI